MKRAEWLSNGNYVLLTLAGVYFEGTVLTRSRRFRSSAGIAALAAMLFVQAAMALAACDAFRTPSQALMIAAQDADKASCHEAEQNANLCLAHCQSGDQTLDKHQVKVPDAATQPVLVLTSGPARAAVAAPALWSAAPVVGPPPRILYQSLLI